MATTKTATKRRASTRKTTQTAKPPKIEETSAELLAPTSIKTIDVDTDVEPSVAKTEPRDGSEPARKNELIELAVARSGVKKRDAKPAIEAALAIMGEMVADGRELNLQGFGKLKVKRTVEVANGTVVHARLRRPQETDLSALVPLAPAAE